MDIQQKPSAELDIEALQREISALSGVRAARVVAGPAGRISEVHLVADGEKAPKQIVRDVQTLAMARFGFEIDYRVVSIVQFHRDTMLTRPKSNRATVLSVSWTTENTHSTCRVVLDAGENRAAAEARGGANPQSRARIAAQAAALAVREIDLDTPPLEVVDANIVEVGGRRIALAVLLQITASGDRTLVGSCLVRGDDAEAVVRAVLNGYNAD